MEGLAQEKKVLTISNSAVMVQLAQITANMNSIQAQLKTLSETSISSTRPKRKYYCWSFGKNFIHVIKARYSNKLGQKYKAYYKKRIGVSKKGRK